MIKRFCTRNCDCPSECQLGEVTVEQHVEKAIQDRIQHVIGNPDLFKVFQQFGGDVFRRSCIFHGLEKFLRQQDVRGNCMVEWGSWNGLTAIVFARRFERVVSLDIAHNPIKHEIVKHLGITNIKFIDIKDNAEKAIIVNGMKFDAAFLDGDHAHDTFEDWRLVRNKAKHVLWHEVWSQMPSVLDLVNSLPQDQVARGGINLALWTRK